MAGEKTKNPDGPTAQIKRDALLGLIDLSSAPERQSSAAEPAYVHTVPRDRLRARTGVEVLDVAPLQPYHARPVADRDLDDEIGPSVSPLLVLGVITLLIVTFIAATQLR